MRNLAAPLLLCYLLIALPAQHMGPLAPACSLQVLSLGEDYVFLYKLNVTYTNEGPGSWELSDAELAFTMFMNTSWQRARLIWSSRPVKRIEMDVDGNLWAIISVPDRVLGPGESVRISLKFEIITSPRDPPPITRLESGDLDDIPSWLKRAYCGRAACWLTEDEELRDLAFRLAEGKTKVLDILAAFIKWIHEEITYVAHEVPFYPNETYMYKEGDCDDQANLLITLCRIVGIPAYLQLGCIYVPEATPRLYRSWEGHCETYVRSIGWHGWAVVYVPPWGWLPVDLTACMGLEEDPLNAIRTAIAWSQHTIMAAEIKVTDYIALSRSYREKVIHSGLHIREEEELKFVKKITSTTYPVRLYKQLLIYLTISVLVLGLTALGVAIYLLRRSRRAEVPAVVYPGQPGLAIRRSRLVS